jgi:predicted small lipoprotein YifL
MKPVRMVAMVALVAVAGCGKVAPLEPPPGQSLPVKPAMASVTPDAEQLLTPPSYARPERIDELMKRSQPRRADRFDLPPPSGEAPVLPETQEENSSEEAGPVTPQ